MTQDVQLREREHPRSQPTREGAAGRHGRPPRARRTGGDGLGWRSTFAEWAGRALLLAAWWSLLRTFLPHVHSLDAVDDAFNAVNVPAGPGLFSTVLLFILGGAVRRRMRAAWWLLIGFQAVSAVYTSAVLSGLAVDNRLYGEANSVAGVVTAVNLALTAVVSLLLVGSRRAFTSLVEAGSRGRALVVLATGLATSIAVSIALTIAFPGRLRDLSHELHGARRVVFGLRPDHTDLALAGQHGHGWVAAVASTLSGLSVLAAAVVFVRSARERASLDAQAELEIRGLLGRHGERDSLGWFATRRDKSAVFAPRRDAALTYRVVASVSVASADPVGAPEAWPAAIDAWLRESRAHGWYPAVLAASEAGAQAYTRAGLRAIPMGDEAIIDCADFTLAAPSMQPIRRAVRRIRRLGYTITVQRHEELEDGRLAELARSADRWRVDETERGFSMALGRLGDPLDGRSVAVLAHDREGTLRGLLSLVPWGQRGLSLDLMRRDRASDNGLNEAMVAALVQHARSEWGITRVSLNFAMFRGVFGAAERVGAGPLVRLTHRLMRFASRYWQIESLYRTNARYRPRWETRYFCYDSALTLIRAAVAAGAAEGFLPLPGSRPVESPGARIVDDDGEQVPLAVAVERQQERIAAEGAAVPQRKGRHRSRTVKLDRLVREGHDPYPVSVPRDAAIADVVRRPAGGYVSVVGRVRASRDHGGIVFLVLQEGAATVQAMLRRDRAGGFQAAARRLIDLGDLVSVSGQVVTSERGELSVDVERWQMAAKCLAPVPKLRPSERPGAARERQLQLLVRPELRNRLELRARAVGRVRSVLAERGFVEVETPMLQAVHGGANARPFITRSNAQDMPLYLRIAPELHLKRLLVAGLPRIYELNRNFRNEGIDDSHQPEFTSLEVYEAYSDYRGMQDLATELIRDAATAMFGDPVALRRDADGRLVEVDLSGEWRATTVLDAVSAACGERVGLDTGLAELRRICHDHAVPTRPDATPGSLITALYEQLVEPRTTMPTFYLDFPVESSPLTRPHRDDPRLSERWDLVAWGRELGTAYSELTDPVEQRRRLTEQSLRRAAGDVEAMQLDEDFLSALALAMPPTGGLGLGIDRLMMTLWDGPIRDTVAFPFPGRAATSGRARQTGA